LPNSSKLSLISLNIPDPKNPLEALMVMDERQLLQYVYLNLLNLFLFCIIA
jgi:hypothetical protein